MREKENTKNIKLNNNTEEKLHLCSGRIRMTENPTDNYGDARYGSNESKTRTPEETIKEKYQ